MTDQTTIPASPKMDWITGGPAIADYLSVSLRTAYSLLEQGEIPGCKVGGVWRLRPAAMLDHVKDREAACA